MRVCSSQRVCQKQEEKHQSLDLLGCCLPCQGQTLFMTAQFSFTLEWRPVAWIASARRWPACLPEGKLFKIWRLSTRRKSDFGETWDNPRRKSHPTASLCRTIEVWPFQTNRSSRQETTNDGGPSKPAASSVFPASQSREHELLGWMKQPFILLQNGSLRCDDCSYVPIYMPRQSCVWIEERSQQSLHSVCTLPNWYCKFSVLDQRTLPMTAKHDWQHARERAYWYFCFLPWEESGCKPKLKDFLNLLSKSEVILSSSESGLNSEMQSSSVWPFHCICTRTVSQ